jgi:hypothetical protein
MVLSAKRASEDAKDLSYDTQRNDDNDEDEYLF